MLPDRMPAGLEQLFDAGSLSALPASAQARRHRQRLTGDLPDDDIALIGLGWLN